MAILNSSDISARLQLLAGWELDGREIRKNFKFKDFPASMSFVNKVAELAEEMDHHPDILIKYNRVTLSLSTHSESGLTGKDFDLAGKIENIANPA